jgi:hypothetical protein
MAQSGHSDCRNECLLLVSKAHMGGPPTHGTSIRSVPRHVEMLISRRGAGSRLAARLQPAVGGKEFVPHAHDCIGRFFKIDVFGGRCLRNNTSSCLKCIALKGAGLQSRH